MTDWLPELSDDDLATLMEALEAWEDKDASSEMFGDVMEMIVTPQDPDAKVQLRESRERDKITRRQQKAVRKERSVLLRAKLLTLRNGRRVDRVVGSADPRD